MTDLYTDALRLSINKNISDIRTLLLWAEEAGEVREKVMHAEQALRFLHETVENLRQLR